jgi:hypothetical protein
VSVSLAASPVCELSISCGCFVLVTQLVTAAFQDFMGFLPTFHPFDS